LIAGEIDRISGNINILQLTSDVLNYTILLQLYNFVGNNAHVRALGVKLKSTFSVRERVRMY